MTAFPPPDATRAEVEAWARARVESRFGPALERAIARVLFAPWCSACGKVCEVGNVPLTGPTRIRFSAKFKGRVFAVGQRLCNRHQTAPVKELP